MPTLNAFRTVNLSYNDGKRAMTVAPFQPNGRQTLMVLDNGGGKSVMAHILQQPCLPTSKLYSRDFRTYLECIRNGKPLVILMEWKHERYGNAEQEYTLQCMVATTANDRDNDAANNINWFEVISHYSERQRQSFPLTFGNVPFVEISLDGSIRIESYNKCKDIAKKLERENAEIWFCTTKSEVSRRLRTFSILTENWSEIMSQFNGQEKGFEGFMKTCDTSEKLFDSFIASRIDPEADKGEDDKRYIELLLNHIDKRAKNMDTYYARENIAKFQEPLEHISSLAEAVCTKVAGRNKAAGEAYAFSQKLKEQETTLKESYQDAKVAKAEAEAEILKIKQEQASEQWYDADKAYKAASDALIDANNKLEALKQEKDECEHRVKVIRAAEIASELHAEEAAYQTLVEKKKAFGDSEERKTLSLLGGKLKRVSREILEEKESAIEECKRSVEQAETQKADIESKLKSLKSEEKSAEEVRNRLDKEKDKAGELFNTLAAEYPNDVIRDLLGVLDEARILSAIASWQEQAQKLDAQTAEYHKNIDTLVSEIETLRNTALQELYKRNFDAAQKLEDAKRKRENYAKNLESAKIQKQELGLFHSEEDEAIIHELNDKMSTLSIRLETLSHEKRDVNVMIDNVNNGSFFLPESISGLMELAKVEYKSGFTYVSDLESELQKQMLEKFPLLPYSILIREKDMRNLADGVKATLLQLVPIFTFEQLSSAAPMTADSAICRIGETGFLYGYDIGLFTENGRKLFLEEKREQLERLETEALAKQGTLDECCRFHTFLLANSFSSAMEHELSIACERAAQMLSDTEHAIQQVKADIGQKEREVKTTEGKINQIRTESDDVKKRICKFEELLNNEPKYQAIVSQFKAAEGRLDAIRDDIETQESARSIVYDYKVQANSALSIANNAFQQANAVCQKYASYTEYEEETVEPFAELESRYNTLREAIGENEESLENKIKETRGKADKLKQKLRRTGIQEEELAGVVYSYDEEDKCNSALKQVEEKAAQQNAICLELATDAGFKESTLKSAQSKLGDVGLQEALPESEIRSGDYKARIENAKLDVKTADDIIKEVDNQLRKCTSAQGTVRSITTSDIERDESIRGIILEDDVTTQADIFRDKYRDACDSVHKACEAYREEVSRQKTAYNKGDATIQGILATETYTFTKPSAELALEEAKASHLQHQRQIQSLNNLIQKYDSNLKAIQDEFSNICGTVLNIVKQALDNAKRLSDMSTVQLEEGESKKRMLRFKSFENAIEGGDSRVTQYLEDNVRAMAQRQHEATENREKVIQTVKERVKKELSLRNLMNRYVGKDKMQIEVYKIEKNYSRMVSWEEAVGNSGGEKTVTFFAVISTLMAYSDERAGKDDGIRHDQLILLDNPFAQMSSQHLVNAMQAIARKNRIQLICLTALRETNILKAYDIVYYLSVKLENNKERVKIDRVEGLNSEEVVDGIFLSQRVEQQSLF